MATLPKHIADLWNFADKNNLVAIRDSFVRNKDAAVRQAFKESSNVDGSYAWALTQVMYLRNPECDFSAEKCNQIIQIIMDNKSK